MFRVGIVGHRYLANDETTSFVADECLDILEQFQANHPGLIALSAIAEGTDTLFAEAALQLKIPLEIVRPFDAYASDFETESAMSRYLKLRAAARSEEKLAHKERSDIAYRAAMNWIVRKSDVLVIAWNGLPDSSLGGTGAAVNQVVRLNRPWFYLDVTDFDVTFHPNARGATKGGFETDDIRAQHSRGY